MKTLSAHPTAAAVIVAVACSQCDIKFGTHQGDVTSLSDGALVHANCAHKYMARHRGVKIMSTKVRMQGVKLLQAAGARS